MLSIPLSLGLGLSLAALAMASCRASEVEIEPDLSTNVYEFTLTANDGSEYPLAQHRGKVVLLVNTASRCGFTKQYKGLQALHADYADKGLVVIGVPSNDFMGQEPGTDEEIAEFCEINFGVSFPLMARSVVKGEAIIPLYDYLTKRSHFPAVISWNFNKFLIGPDGVVIDRQGSRATPESMRETIESALAALPQPEEPVTEEAATSEGEDTADSPEPEKTEEPKE